MTEIFIMLTDKFFIVNSVSTWKCNKKRKLSVFKKKKHIKTSEMKSGTQRQSTLVLDRYVCGNNVDSGQSIALLGASPLFSTIMLCWIASSLWVGS